MSLSDLQYALSGGLFGYSGPQSQIREIMAQQQGFPSALQQAAASQAAQARQQSLAMEQMFMARGAPTPTPCSPPKRKKVESKVIETVEIRSPQDTKLLRAGEGL